MTCAKLDAPSNYIFRTQLPLGEGFGLRLNIVHKFLPLLLTSCQLFCFCSSFLHSRLCLAVLLYVFQLFFTPIFPPLVFLDPSSLYRCPNHISCFFSTICNTYSTFSSFRMSLLAMQSPLSTPLIFLGLLISISQNLLRILSVRTHVSRPLRRTGLNTVLYYVIIFICCEISFYPH